MIRDIQTPLFLVEAKFDWYQLHMNQFTDDKIFKNCTDDVTLCSPSHFETMKEYGVALTKSLQEIRDTSPSIGMFAHPCFRHGHFYDNLGWDASYKLKNKTIAQAIGDWYNERDCSTFQEIDTAHEYPLNRDCTEIPSI
ncbi:Pectin acetylesterase 7 [Striga hermonthica]|uniref:Pectin acetylesterase n=1 Tax=Striga hermonthica TaxID=68872 RepID=A0A9N7MPB8_STRHE|nr:Pectin acetylesterase 7 [Striga hermonthica]